mgnify:CR=1 FL=1
MNNSFYKKNIIVTGGNSGSGLAISKKFLNLGSNVIRIDKVFDKKIGSSDFIFNLEKYGGFGLGMGVEGAALASVVSQTIVFTIFVYMLFWREHAYISFDLRNFNFSTDLMKEKKVAQDDLNTVHYRRDLDSLG